MKHKNEEEIAKNWRNEDKWHQNTNPSQTEKKRKTYEIQTMDKENLIQIVGNQSYQNTERA